MSRNIVICCDGTSNQFAPCNTNVVKLCQLLIKDLARQAIYYHPGLGTREPLGFKPAWRRLVARVAGLAFGFGIKQDVAELYQFVMNQWRPGDRLYLFGFSRGAYTVRALAAMIHLYGLAMPGNQELIPYAVRLFWSMRGQADEDETETAARFALATQFREALSIQPAGIHFLGVWDTVSSVGWVGSPVSLPYTRRNPSVAIARHAVAIDERRAFFRTNLLDPAPGQDVAQVWFPGSHCDVGGGYPEAECDLSNITLGWMIAEAEAAGLLFDKDRIDAYFASGQGKSRDPAAPYHESLTGAWKLAEFAPKRHWNRQTGQEEWRLNRFRRRWLGPVPRIAATAWARDASYVAALPGDAQRTQIHQSLIGTMV
ncbi:DUF2235 domain-containing protein [Novosphingobium sp. BL-8A]|uniref:DUF2235 domain-containing protein n=1 Tax=Novosphingobium sp. BL-8A TaxID=3127639 RepID=UPI00375674FF